VTVVQQKESARARSLANVRRVVARDKSSKNLRVKIVVDDNIVKNYTNIDADEKAPDSLTMKERLDQNFLAMVEDNKITTMSEAQSIARVKLACERRLKRNSKE
jgi:hypothetical protein